MQRFIICLLLLVSSQPIYGQESEIVVRYGFTNKSSPPMKVFYIRVFVDGVFADSTKPHMPHHNLANAVHSKVQIGPHKIKIEGWVKDETGNSLVTNKVMEWAGNFNVTKTKCRILIKMNEHYEVELYTVPDF